MDDLRLTTPERFSHFSPCQMPRGRPRGRQMPDPRAVTKFKCPTPGLKCEQMPD